MLSPMSDDSRKLLKIFGVTVTDFEAEADKLRARADQLSAETPREELLAMLKDTTEAHRELNRRWLEITQHVFALQERLLSAIGGAAAPRG
jgi:hypothetical protein